MKKFILLAALFATILPTMADDVSLTPVPFRKLPVSTPMYTAEQVDALINGAVPHFYEKNVIIGYHAFGDSRILDTSVAPFNGDGMEVGQPQLGNVAVGCEATNMTHHGVAVGRLAKTGDFDTTAVGLGALAIPHHSTAIDSAIYGPGFSDTAIRSTILGGIYNTAIATTPTNAVQANGIESQCQYATAIGSGATVKTGVKCGTAIGLDAVATTDGQIVIGNENTEVKIGKYDLVQILARVEECESKLADIENKARLLLQAIEGRDDGSRSAETEITMEDFLRSIVK